MNQIGLFGHGDAIVSLSVRAPFSELIADGRKSIEVRSWTTAYRGELLIVSGGQWHPQGARVYGRIGQRGVAVCLVELVECRRYVDSDLGPAMAVDHAGNLARGEYAWVLENPRRVEPVSVLGKLSLFRVARSLVTLTL